MKRTLFILSCAAILLSSCTSHIDCRERLPLFARQTWNAHDATDTVPGYERTEHVFTETVAIPASWAESNVTFVSLGANQEVWLSVNGNDAGYHAGGYTAFSFDVTPFVRFGEDNTVTMRITNAHNADIPPLSADFTFFGGPYRDCYLLRTAPSHISTTFYGTNGLTVETPAVNYRTAQVRITTRLTNANEGMRVEHRLNGKRVAISDKIGNDQLAADNVNARPEDPRSADYSDVQTFNVDNPRLWSPDSPTLYTLTTRLLGEDGRVIDQVEQEIGLRYYSFDEQGLFVLNGKPLKLIGTNRHQCYSGMGWAVPDSVHRLDMQLLKDMGGNFLRVSHYPQDPLVMHLLDSLGILCSVEIPVVNAITESEAFTNNCLMMEEEMVWQNRNHPSVIMWGYMNEVLLRPPFKYQKGMWQRHWEYVMNVNRLSQQLNRHLHELDPERYTFAAIHDYFREYHEAGLDTCADVIGHNIYSGWYSGTIEDLDAKVERIRRQSSNRPMLISEYGADCDVRLRADNPLKFDYTVDYAMLYHKHYLQFLLSTDLVAGGTAWNLNDFHSESRGGAVPHMNLKGLVTTNRCPKATYYFYQSTIAGTEALRRQAQQKMEEALRMPEPQQWPLCVLLGSNRYFTDNNGNLWVPDTTSGLITIDGGTPYVRKTEHGPLPASDVTILGAAGDEPVYQTARLGINELRADVPDGQYTVTLRLAELETVGEQEMSVYNLGNKALDTGFNGRKMSITINGEQVFSPEETLQTYRAKDIVQKIDVNGGNGIIIVLKPIEGATILNAVKIEPTAR
ncbi:MAG: hypothetical protein IJS13_03290 [Paludibacteraceae bacterium]|nr:hypothetical protein [Paludibacteraceae bacterium]